MFFLCVTMNLKMHQSVRNFIFVPFDNNSYGGSSYAYLF